MWEPWVLVLRYPRQRLSNQKFSYHQILWFRCMIGATNGFSSQVETVTCGDLSQNQSGLSQSSPHLITVCSHFNMQLSRSVSFSNWNQDAITCSLWRKSEEMDSSQHPCQGFVLMLCWCGRLDHFFIFLFFLIRNQCLQQCSVSSYKAWAEDCWVSLECL